MSSSDAGDGPPVNKSEIPRGLINRTGNPTGRGARLPSVRGQRDLTLGGVQRKVFTPNLAAVKKSSKEENQKTVASTSSAVVKEHGEGSKGRGHGRSERGRGRGRGRGKGDDRTIQLQSEFSHGPMGSSQGSAPRASWGSGGGGGSGGGRSTGSGESNSKGGSMRAMKRMGDGVDDKKMLDTLLRDDFVTDLSDGDAHMTPIKLPLHLNHRDPGLNIKKEETVEVKREIDTMETDEQDNSSVKEKDTIGPTQSASVSTPLFMSFTTKDILSSVSKSEKGELLLIQLPDTLPGVPPIDADEKPHSSSTSNVTEVTKKMNLCQLKDCNEGYMGKLRIRQSGKTELVLDDNVMEVLPGIPINFHQELVSVHTNQNPGQMIVLGPVNNKLVVTPDYNNLLQNAVNF